MHEWESLSHVRWECKYHVVIIPKGGRSRIVYAAQRIIDVMLSKPLTLLVLFEVLFSLAT